MDAFAILCSITAPSRIRVGAYGGVRVPTTLNIHEFDSFNVAPVYYLAAAGDGTLLYRGAANPLMPWNVSGFFFG